jgi:hypothetical protein
MKLDPIFVATVVVFLLMVAIAAFLFRPHFENPKVIFREAPIDKNAEFQLRPGETYRYVYMLNDTPINMTYSVLAGRNCTRIRFMESRNISESCINKQGMDEMGYNSTLTNPTMILFKPWMLALEEGWRWNSSMYVFYDGAEQHISDTSYRVVRKDELNGTGVFIVEIIMDDNPPEYQWIDAEKRVLLRIESNSYEINRVY